MEKVLAMKVRVAEVESQKPCKTARQGAGELSGQAYTLLLQRTQVLFPLSMLQLSVTPALENVVPLVSSGTCPHVCIPTTKHIIKNNKNKS